MHTHSQTVTHIHTHTHTHPNMHMHIHIHTVLHSAYAWDLLPRHLELLGGKNGSKTLLVQTSANR